MRRALAEPQHPQSPPFHAQPPHSPTQATSQALLSPRPHTLPLQAPIPPTLHMAPSPHAPFRPTLTSAFHPQTVLPHKALLSHSTLLIGPPQAPHPLPVPRNPNPL